jgi:hypothetical protein
MKAPFRVWIPMLIVAISVSKVATQSAPPVTVIAYGDTRFTDPSNVTATSPRARGALIACIADERPEAVFISGDVPWHGGVANDYAQFRLEATPWRAAGIRVLPALGNHEFSQRKPRECVESWWAAFPELRGQRWYASAVGDRTRVLALDTMSALTSGSPQRLWLEHEVQTLPSAIDFVLIVLHHPPVADVQTRVLVDHNPRPNEIALTDYFKRAAPTLRARLIVIAGHIHNYERQFQDDVMYVVSGGGGAVPYEVDRTPQDLYQGIDFPNYHDLKLTIAAGTLKGEMFRLDEAAAPRPHFTLKDSFELSVRRPASQ